MWTVVLFSEKQQGKADLYRGIPWLCPTPLSSSHSPFFHKYFFPEFLCKTQKERCPTEKQTRRFRLDFDKFSIAKESGFPLALQDRQSITALKFT